MLDDPITYHSSAWQWRGRLNFTSRIVMILKDVMMYLLSMRKNLVLFKNEVEVDF
jgi:hypothetical protein